MNEVLGKKAVVTGAAGGIGAATALVLAKEGAEELILSDVDQEGLEQCAEHIRKNTKCSCLVAKTDLLDTDSIQKLFTLARERWKGLDILVNCAGICPVKGVEEISWGGWDITLTINLKSVFFCCKEALQLMIPNSAGSIVNVSSISGQIGGIATGADYVASKGGILALTKSMAKYAGPFGIMVNVVSPGFIDTKMTQGFTHFDPQAVPLRRIGNPEDVADVILFLSSDRARYVTGATININGGVYM
jgi:3-oxoacyl-[acyl-carrier protein] reductase